MEFKIYGASAHEVAEAQLAFPEHTFVSPSVLGWPGDHDWKWVRDNFKHLLDDSYANRGIIANVLYDGHILVVHHTTAAMIDPGSCSGLHLGLPIGGTIPRVGMKSIRDLIWAVRSGKLLLAIPLIVDCLEWSPGVLSQYRSKGTFSQRGLKRLPLKGESNPDGWIVVNSGYQIGQDPTSPLYRHGVDMPVRCWGVWAPVKGSRVPLKLPEGVFVKFRYNRDKMKK